MEPAPEACDLFGRYDAEYLISVTSQGAISDREALGGEITPEEAQSEADLPEGGHGQGAIYQIIQRAP